MPRVLWPLVSGRPSIEISLTLAADGTAVKRVLVADTGAASMRAPFDFILEEDDCLLCGGTPTDLVQLGGAYLGTFPIYVLWAEIPAIGVGRRVRAVGVDSAPLNFNGLACFAFLNQFTYGNFGNPDQFGLET